MRFLLFILSLTLIISCSNRKEDKKIEDRSESPETTFHAINAFGSIYGDTSTFIKLKCGLYLNNQGILAYRTINQLASQHTTPLYVYLSTIYDADPSDTLNGGQKEMKFVVDTSTFKILGTFYFKDKNHFYVFNPVSDGGTISINTNIDRNTFQILEGEFYGKDYKHCFYRGHIIEGADLKTFRVLDTSYSPYLAYDKHNFYEGEYKMSRADIKQLRLDSILRKKNGL